MPCKPDIMYQRIIVILFLLCACCIQSSTAYGQKVNYQQFDNIYLGGQLFPSRQRRTDMDRFQQGIIQL